MAETITALITLEVFFIMFSSSSLVPQSFFLLMIF